MKLSVLKNRRGFTLIEMILYATILSIFFVVVVTFFWQMRQSHIRSEISGEVKENAAQVIELFQHVVRESDDVVLGSSQFDQDLGVLELDYVGGNRRFDTYIKNVTIGSESVPVRKLRMVHVGFSNNDLTSDSVTVDRLRFTDLTHSGSPVIQVELELSKVTPENDPLYQLDYSTRSSVMIRKES